MCLNTIVQKNRGIYTKQYLSLDDNYIISLLFIIVMNNGKNKIDIMIINIDELIHHPIGLLSDYLRVTKEVHYDFLPEYESFSNDVYYNLLNSFDKYQTKNFYVSFYCKWINTNKALTEKFGKHKYEDKIVLPYQLIDIKNLNSLLKEFIDDKKILGLIIINMLQKTVLG